MAAKCKAPIVRTMVRRYFSDGVARSAAELSYFLLFTFCPLLMFLTSLLAQVHLSEDSLASLLQFLPREVQDMIVGYIQYIRIMPKVQPMMIGTVLTLYFLSRAVRSMMNTLNGIYRVRRRQGVLYRVVVSVLMSAGLLLAIFGGMLLIVCGRTLFRLVRTWLPIPEVVTSAVESASYPIAVVFLFLFVLALNKIVPNVRLRWSDAAPGALVSFAAWLLLSYAFSFYVDNMARYSLLYGSLGAIIVLMLWLYLTSIILIMGAVLNHIRLLRRTGKADVLPGV